MTFSHLFVIGTMYNPKNNRFGWEVLCDLCGKTRWADGTALKRGSLKSCGDHPQIIVTNPEYTTFVGLMFDRWIVLEEGPINKHKQRTWLCECQCPKKTRKYKVINIKTGCSKSCGCIMKEIQQTEKFKEKVRQNTKKQWEDKESRLKLEQAAKERWSNPEEKQKQSERRRVVPYDTNIKHLSRKVKGLSIYRKWANEIRARDGWTCVLCEAKPNKINVDHIKSFSQIMFDYNITTINEAIGCKELWDTDNGRVLCIPCHKKTDSYGSRYKTSLQNPPDPI